MKEARVQAFLHGFRRASRQIGLYPEDHPLTVEAMEVAIAALERLADGAPEVVLSIHDDAFFLDGDLLAHTSLEYNSLLREFHMREISSITFLWPVSSSDLFDFAAFVARSSDDLPAESTIRLNENSLMDRTDGISPLRRSYAGSLQVLRSASDTMAREGAFDLGAVMGSVEVLLDASAAEASAALLLSTVKSFDEYTFYHSVNTCILSLALGRLIGLTDEELMPVGAGALLHDIGKVSIPRNILNHPGRLDADGWKEVEMHPQEGAHAIYAAAGVGHEVAATVALEHHTRFDGTGYPMGDRHRPTIFSSLVSVVDVYDALTTRRRYRRADTPNRALHTLLNESGTTHHPALVRAFIHLMGLYPPGSVLQLRNGSTVVVTGTGSDPRSFMGVVPVDGSGSSIEPEPVVFDIDEVVQQLQPDRIGINPASLLESEGVAAQLGSSSGEVEPPVV